MSNEEIKLQIGANIALYRKEQGLTQAELAQRLNYTDKAVSKWERGESVPDVLTITQIAGQFGISVDELIYGPDAASRPVPAKRRSSKRAIQILVSMLVWFVALFIYVMVDSYSQPYGWLAFFAAAPVNAIVLLSLRSAWHKYNWNLYLVSIIMWGCLVLLHVVLLVSSGVNVWRIFLLGVLGQGAIILCFRLFRRSREDD